MNTEEIQMGDHNLKQQMKSLQATHTHLQLINEAEAYISFLDRNGFPERSGDTGRELDPEQLYFSLRNKERQENNKTILQYLLVFLNFLCSSKIIKEDMVNPFEQFRNFVLFNIHLLKEVDVIQAIIRYGQKGNELKKNWNEYYWRLKISRIYHQCLGMIKDRSNKSIMDCFNCFVVLMDLCQFWFDIHYRNDCPIRHSDILTYKICKAIIKNLEQKKINTGDPQQRTGSD